MSGEFSPRLIAFLCNWCSYGGADLAGVSRLQYPPNIRVVRVMCSGRVDPAFILKAFFDGADGVLVGGCHPGDCHYIKGNYYAERRIKITQRLLDILGIGRERLRLEWVSAAEGTKFAAVVNDFTSRLQELGPRTSRVSDANYDALARVASAMGSVGTQTLKGNTCMADLAKYFLGFTQRESCAECIPCRIGTKRMLEILERVVDGQAEEAELSLLEQVASAVGPAAKCGLGRIAGEVVVNALKYCRDEFKTHLQGTCPGTVEANPGWEPIVGTGGY
jgi:coenzyme F420-reducing hydrogenase delta subunit